MSANVLLEFSTRWHQSPHSPTTEGFGKENVRWTQTCAVTLKTFSASRVQLSKPLVCSQQPLGYSR